MLFMLRKHMHDTIITNVNKADFPRLVFVQSIRLLIKFLICVLQVKTVKTKITHG